MASNISAIAIASCSLPSTSSSIAARIQPMSAPAQNDGPSPASTTARRSAGSSRANAAKVAASSAMSDASNALWTSGRVSVTRAIGVVRAGPIDAKAIRHGRIVSGRHYPRARSRRHLTD